MSDATIRALERRVNATRSCEALAELDAALRRVDGGPWLPAENRHQQVLDLIRAGRPPSEADLWWLRTMVGRVFQWIDPAEAADAEAWGQQVPISRAVVAFAVEPLRRGMALALARNTFSQGLRATRLGTDLVAGAAMSEAAEGHAFLALRRGRTLMTMAGVAQAFLTNQPSPNPLLSALRFRGPIGSEGSVRWACGSIT